MPDDITLGEMSRRLADVQATVHELRDKMDRDYVRAADLTAIDKRVGALEASVTWVVRIVVGAVVVALLGLVIAQGRVA